MPQSIVWIGRPLPMTADTHDVLLFADQVWDADVPTNRQQTAARLPTHLDCRVVYVEPPSFALSPLLGLNRVTESDFHFANGSRHRLSPFLQCVDDSVYIVSPLLPVPHRYAKHRPSVVFASVRRFVKRAVAKLNVEDPLVWSYSPFGTAYLPETIDPTGIVYDCVDRYDQLGYYTDYSLDVSEYQERMLAASDAVFVTSEPLYDLFSDRHPTVELTGNAADIGLFETAGPGGRATVAPELRDVPSPIAGFYGVLSEYKIDFDLLERLVKRVPELTLVLIGPVKTSLPGWVDDRSDVLRITRRPQHELPEYLTAFDVCLLPYKTNKYTEGVEPLKLYEYLAARKPVVATPFADLPDLGDWLCIASANEPFIRTVGSTIETQPESPPPDVSDRDWNEKVRRMMLALTDEGVVRDGTLVRTSSESNIERR